MASSSIKNVVVGGIALETVMQATTGASTAGTVDIYSGADTKDECSVNAIIKYLNIRLQCAVKDEIAPANAGWIEYGLVRFENEAAVPGLPADITAAIGTQTLGEILDNKYREYSVWSGAVPISLELPVVLDLKIKCPAKFCKVRRGTYWMFFYTFRTHFSTDTLSEIRGLYSHQYKVYI